MELGAGSEVGSTWGELEEGLRGDYDKNTSYKILKELINILY